MFKKEVGKKMTENADTQSNNSESTEKMEGTEGNALVIVNVNVTCELSIVSIIHIVVASVCCLNGYLIM